MGEQWKMIAKIERPVRALGATQELPGAALRCQGFEKRGCDGTETHPRCPIPTIARLAELA